MAEEKKDEKKIIVDEDWKQQAEKEKEKLVAEEEAEKQKAGGHRHGPLPKGDFTGLVSMLFTQTLFSLGFLQAKGEEQRPPDLGLAKFNIDLLEMLEEKTKGNLTEQEKRMLSGALNQLRMGFVEASK